ncbi:MAG: MarR family winged helix-turn-helix transcriptional regulator [Candidatus Limnocylindrales bacterium]
MSLNVGAGTPSTTAGPERHRRVADELATELASWNPRERMGAFKAWHRGALSLVHLNVVTVIEAEGPLPMGRLADALDVSVASVTGIVSRMEQRGLVERRHDQDDRRVVLVHLTEAGARIFSDLEARRREGLGRLLERLSDEQLDGFLAGIRVLRAAHQELATKGAEAADR